VLMALLFFGGVMNLWWIGGLTLFVLLEKVLPCGALAGRVSGGIAAGCGLLLIVHQLF
jgi:predicted metal-binding membrane protein